MPANSLGYSSDKVHERSRRGNPSLGSPNFLPISRGGVVPELIRTLPSEASVVTKKVDYLERQEKILSQTINTDRRRMSDQMRVNSERLHNDMQFVYARAMRDLYGSQAVGSASSCIANNTTTCLVAKRGDTCLFVYPMELVTTEDNSSSYMMRCKTVDPMSGQLGLYWVPILYTTKEKKMQRFIGKFSLH